MNLLGGGRAAVPHGDLFVVEHGVEQALRCGSAMPATKPRSSRPHLAGVALGGREVVGELHLALVHAPHLVHGELRAVLVDLDQALHLDEIVAVEGVHHLGHVVPHLGVHLAGAVAEAEREVKLAALLLADLLGPHQEAGGDHPVGLEFVDKGRFHENRPVRYGLEASGCAAGAAGAAGVADAAGCGGIDWLDLVRHGPGREHPQQAAVMARGNLFLGGGLRASAAPGPSRPCPCPARRRVST